MSSHIINNVKNIGLYSYLELGVCDNVNFDQILAGKKYSVDINGKAKFTGTTDQFFSQNSDVFDIVYIDANHDLEYVVRDFNNSIKICTKMILIHDMFPPTKMHTESRYCSDSYKLLNYFILNNYNSFTLNEDFGLTFILPNFKEVIYKDVNKSLSYEDFVTFMSNKVVYNQLDMIKIIENI